MYINTSKGITVPIKLAVAFYKQCLAIKDKDLNPINRPLRKILDFKVTEHAVEEDGNVRVGCHYILFKEMKKMYDLISKKNLLLINKQKVA